jgi:transcriptional regulator with XRE-family HTH domain
MKKQSGFERLHAMVRPQQRIADALGLSKEQVSRIARGKSPSPEYMEAIAELLERTPPQDWPKRWK